MDMTRFLVETFCANTFEQLNLKNRIKRLKTSVSKVVLLNRKKQNTSFKELIMLPKLSRF